MNQPLIFERILDAPIDKVWSALTNVAEMKLWYFDVPEFKAEVGAVFTFTGGPDGGPQYKHVCKVTDVEHLKKLAYTWTYEGYEGESVVTWELSVEGSQTRLKLTHTGLETLPASNPDFAVKNFVEGWTYFTTKALPEYLAGK
ncbi:MAG: SRPBCC domain-containing protein [Sphingobacteriales bacterium JAD_PAG50586_3]|nr:MAG: SRPBCC domain-containing protein [Sphingobacteriales bacterium JAD_PAG50586_3]